MTLNFILALVPTVLSSRTRTSCLSKLAVTSRPRTNAGSDNAKARLCSQIPVPANETRSKRQHSQAMRLRRTSDDPATVFHAARLVQVLEERVMQADHQLQGSRM